MSIGIVVENTCILEFPTAGTPQHMASIYAMDLLDKTVHIAVLLVLTAVFLL